MNAGQQKYSAHCMGTFSEKKSHQLRHAVPFLGITRSFIMNNFVGIGVIIPCNK